MKTYRTEAALPVMAGDLLMQPPIHTGEWQAMDTSASDAHATHELEDVTFTMYVPRDADQLANAIGPDLPWAEDHFNERVSGIPHNPPPSAVRWPYAFRGNADHTRCPTCGSRQPSMHPAVSGGGEVTSRCPDPFHEGQSGAFDHTYPERFWPKLAGKQHMARRGFVPSDEHRGIRFQYGDLSDVVRLLVRSPLTRQAYLPVWFPEDTGAVSRQRVPCTLGYHFMIRDNRLSCRYYIRSCDMRRHFVNDVYFAGRLTQWMCDAFNDMRAINGEPPITRHMPGELTPGRLVMHITSLHCFVGDHEAIRERFIKPWTFREATADGIPR